MKNIHDKAFKKLTSIIGNSSTKPLLNNIREVVSDWYASSNLTPNLIHEGLQEFELDYGVSKEAWKEAIDLFLDFLQAAKLVPEFIGDDDDESMTDAFEDYFDEYLRSFPGPEDKDYTVELITHMSYFLFGIDDYYNSDLLDYFTPLRELTNVSREQDGYKKLLEEYDAEQLEASDDVLKSLDPVDVSNLPEYVIDSLYLHNGKYYKPSEVRKMITASSQTAQALEKQDLEDDNEELGLTAEELGRRYIKKLKVKRDKK